MSGRVAIIGSGPAGMSAALPLVEAGIPVLMLEAGNILAEEAPQGHIAALRQDPAYRQVRFGTPPVIPESAVAESPKLSTPKAQRVMAGASARLGLHGDGFTLVAGAAAGGLSSIWGAAVAAFDATDLQGTALSPAELAKSYRTVAERVGLTGSDSDDLAAFYGASLPLDGELPGAPALRRLAHVPSGGKLHIGRARNAVLGQAREARAACNGCGLCLWGCSRGAIYSADMELARLRRHAHFEWRQNLAVESMRRDPEGGWQLRTGEGTLAATQVLLAAGAISTTRLVLELKQLQDRAVRVFSNPVASMAFLAPAQLVARPGSGKPWSFALAQAGWMMELPGGDYATGFFYTADTLPVTALAAELPLSRPAALRLSAYLAPALILATLYLSGRHSRHSAALERDGRLKVSGGLADSAGPAFRQAARGLAKALTSAGLYAVPGSLRIAPPGTDVHYAGSLPMGAEGPLGTGADGALNGEPGLYVVDGAALPVLPAKPLTLTIMANADRIGRRLAEAWKRGA